MTITVVKALEEFYSNLSRCFEEPGRVDRGIGCELLRGESKADVFDPGEEWAVLGSPTVSGFTGFIFSEDAEKSKVVADGISHSLAPVIF